MTGPEQDLRGQTAQPFSHRHWLCLLAITSLAAVLRFYRLGDWAFWVDEAHTWRDATLPHEIFWDSNRAWYPTSFVLVRWLLDALDPRTVTEGVLRMPFAIGGILAVPLIAIMGRQLVGNVAALFAALLLAVNPWHIYWSQNARSYSLMFLFSLMAAGCFWSGIQRKSVSRITLSVLAGVLAVSCHSTGGLVFAPMVAYPLLAGREWNSRLFAVLGGITVLLFVALPPMRHLPPFDEFVRAKANPEISHLFQTVAFYFRLPLLSTAAIGLWIHWQERDRTRPVFLALWAALPLVALAVLGSTVVKTTARYAFGMLPAILLLSSVACVRLHDAMRNAFAEGRRPLRFLPALAVPALLLIDLVVYDYHYFTVQAGDRGLWQQAARQIHELESSSKVTVLTVNEPTMQFYLRRWHYSGNPLLSDKQEGEVLSIETYQMANAGGATQWFEAQAERAKAQGNALYTVITLPELREKDPDRRMEKTIQSRMDLVAAYPISVGPKDETIFVYRARAAK